ncbi:hypothetical protein Taro_030758 [Colocasia esculenta]|uniref:Uncharacterized protein n=1 Tax=Colocasia esculenta TaxID=4460 RepID=A0A843VH49_COLES|nr:hypothetical protein [Colocasia esculenta]
MGVGLRSLASVASSGASHVPPIRDSTIEAHQVERDDDEDEDPLEDISIRIEDNDTCRIPLVIYMYIPEKSPELKVDV